MLQAAVSALKSAGYGMEPLQVLIRANLPPGYRAMTLEDGAVLGSEALASQAMANHVLEEELLHLRQKLREAGRGFGPGTARALEEEIHEFRRFPLPRD